MIRLVNSVEYLFNACFNACHHFWHSEIFMTKFLSVCFTRAFEHTSRASILAVPLHSSNLYFHNWNCEQIHETHERYNFSIYCKQTCQVCWKRNHSITLITTEIRLRTACFTTYLRIKIFISFLLIVGIGSLVVLARAIALRTSVIFEHVSSGYL